MNDRGAFTGSDATWDDAFGTRRFAVGIFHRLRKRIGPDPYGPGSMPDHVGEALAAKDTPREVDVYYVTLRRPESTLRYAQQSRDPASLPDPWDPEASPVLPEAAPYADDVLLPEPWRVQIQITAATLPTVTTSDDHLGSDYQTTGIPSEVRVPPTGVAGSSPEAVTMMMQLFQRGSRFIDERSGSVYRVTNVRLAPDLSHAMRDPRSRVDDRRDGLERSDPRLHR